MPKILDKRAVPGLPGTVVLNGSGTSSGKYFYREWNKTERSYRTEQLTGATSIDHACELAIEVAFKFRQESKEEPTGPRIQRRSGTKTRKVTCSHAANMWVAHELKKYESGLIAKSTYGCKERLVRLYLLPYLESEGCVYTHQINYNTFQNYLIYRANSTPLARQREISSVKEFVIAYCGNHKLLDELPAKNWFPEQVVKATDRMKNPAINPDDWMKLITYVRVDWRTHLRLTGHQNHRAFFWRDLFWHYLLFAKNTGMSPEEILRLKWKNIEIKDVGRIDSKGNRQEWLVAYVKTIRSKTSQPREIPCNQGRELRRWMGIVKDYLKEYGINEEVTGDTLVFGNPNHEFKSYSYSLFKHSWREVYLHLKGSLKGHRFSPHDYTLYSLRSTFIEDHLLKGTDLFLLARIAGHDVKELMRSYEKLDVRTRAKEITAINFNKKKEAEYEVDLLDVHEEEAFDELLKGYESYNNSST